MGGFKINFKKKQKPQDNAKIIEELHSGIKTNERREKARMVLLMLTPRQRLKMAKIMARRQGNGKEK